MYIRTSAFLITLSISTHFPTASPKLAISKNNANEFVNKLSKQGIKASVFEKGKMRRVIIDGFDKQADAYSHLNEIKKKSSDLTSAWVLKL